MWLLSEEAAFVSVVTIFVCLYLLNPNDSEFIKYLFRISLIGGIIMFYYSIIRK